MSNLISASFRRSSSHLALGAGVICVVTALLYFLPAAPPHEFATRTAERQIAALVDGTRVDLNAQTTLTVDFSQQERRVRLTQGEALFNVVSDAARPFVVETPAGVVRVAGTLFNVRADHRQRVEVTVLAGHVRVRGTGATAEQSLAAGEHAVMADRVVVRALADGAAEDVIAWRHGQVVFNDTPLADALDRFAAYHAQPIAVDPGVADLRLGGCYALADLDGFLDSIQRVLGVRVVREPDGIRRVLLR